jgi:2-polyprenyl-3-methyl-5-hydroxy-6-metoxy-1,4-benzoquinol methylase
MICAGWEQVKRALKRLRALQPLNSTVAIMKDPVLRLREVSNQVAEQLLRRFERDRHASDYFGMCRRRFDLIVAEGIARVPPDATVLEVGPAYGHVLLVLSRLGYKTQGSDCPETLVSGQCVSLLEAGVRVTPWDLHNGTSPFEPGSFDLVICSEVLEHLQISLTAALRKVAQQLKPGGVLIVTVPNIYRLTNLRKILNDENIVDPFPHEAAIVNGVVVDRRHHQREPTMAELKAAVGNCGLMIAKASYFNSVWRPRRSELAFSLLPRRLRDHLLVVAEVPA